MIISTFVFTVSSAEDLNSHTKTGTYHYNLYEGANKQDPSNGSENVENFLKEAGFSNVESNEWYHHEMLDNSMGVALGSRVIEENGKKYTLLAIIPRSGGYRQEWAGIYKYCLGKS